jgi:hemolysin type calcium-binding protein
VFPRPARLLAVLVASSLTGLLASTAQALPPTELLGDGSNVIPLKNAAMITRTDDGYRYRAGQQNSHLTITLVDGKILYSDTGTRELRKIPRSCKPQSAAKGIAVLCAIPAKFDETNKMFLEVWPRLGDDFVDGSSLSSRFRLWVLADAGNDTVRGGDGDDFVNGAQDTDQVWGGAGDDWIRTGPGADHVWGDAGDDRLIAGPEGDEVHGGDGDDRVDGGDAGDSLWADAGADNVVCGTGSDHAYIDASDRTSKCESVAGY